MNDLSLWTSIVALVVSLYVGYNAIKLSYKAIRYQVIGLINSQIADKARECNSYLDSTDFKKVPRSNDKISGVLSAIITCEELVNYEAYEKKPNFLSESDVDLLIDKFYLQLHTTIRSFIQKPEINTSDLGTNNDLDIFKEQFQRSREFLRPSINKNQNKVFEKLRQHTIERNKKLVK